MAYWDDLTRHVEGEDMWMGHPRARARINIRVTGDPALWPTGGLLRWLGSRAPLSRAASIGCGTGALERDLVRRGIVQHVAGIEISEAPIAQAVRLAAAEGMSDRIAYHRGDARDWLERAAGYDGIFFHGSLHHFDRVRDLLAAVEGALAPEGVLYLDEYVGPAAAEWGLHHLLIWNLVYRLLVPSRLRRAHVVRAPRNTQDPTESIESSSILPAVVERFRVLERRDYGGNLIAPLYPYLRAPRHDPSVSRHLYDSVVDRLLNLEEILLRHPRLPGCRSHHVVLLATQRVP